jgi:hypothetical protein
MSIFYRAAKIAEDAHASQRYRTGRPYIEHCRRVADAVETIDQKTVAYLHDVVEKGEGWTRTKLEEAGFGLKVPNGFLQDGGSVTSFGEDNDGELFVLSAAGGIYKILPK